MADDKYTLSTGEKVQMFPNDPSEPTQAADLQQRQDAMQKTFDDGTFKQPLTQATEGAVKQLQAGTGQQAPVTNATLVGSGSFTGPDGPQTALLQKDAFQHGVQTIGNAPPSTLHPTTDTPQKELKINLPARSPPPRKTQAITMPTKPSSLSRASPR
jgi:hypothetical protein